MLLKNMVFLLLSAMPSPKSQSYSQFFHDLKWWQCFSHAQSHQLSIVKERRGVVVLREETGHVKGNLGGF